MRLNLHHSLLIIGLFVCLLSMGQSLDIEKEKNLIVESRIEFLLDNNESGEADYTTLFEQLEFYYRKPINLNKTSYEELQSLGLINDILINNLLTHIKQNGTLFTAVELQTVEGFDAETIRLILPFVTVNSNLDSPNVSFREIINDGDNQLFMRYTRILEEQEGFSDISDQELEDNMNARYLGSRDRIYTRYKFTYSNNVSAGITAEKDPGEEFFKGTQKEGFDFYSGHLYLQNFGEVKELALGDFQAQFGQGLTFWSGLAFGKTADLQTIKRSARGLRPYTSVQEDRFMRGGGITLQKGNFELTAFYSRNKVDANVTDTIDDQETLVFSSLGESGFHRTPNELKNKNRITRTYFGGHLTYKKRNLNIGITAARSELEGDFRPTSRIYNQFSQLGNENTNVGIDYNYIYKNFNFFGEVSQSIDGGMAMTNGVLVYLDPKLSLAVQQRKFDRDFKAFESNAIGESTANSNEEGIFMGINAKPFKTINISAYFDRFIFPWLRFQADGPSNGFSYLAQVTFSPNKKLSMYGRIRTRERGASFRAENENLDRVVNEKQQAYRYNISYKINKSWDIDSRVEFSRYQQGDQPKEFGYLVYQDVSYKSLSSPFSFSLRYALFDTDSYDSRIYAYENSVLYAFAIPAYNGRGTRFYLSTKYHISRGIDLWVRYAQTYYTDRNVIGSSKDQINGNTKSEVIAQLRFKF